MMKMDTLVTCSDCGTVLGYTSHKTPLIYIECQDCFDANEELERDTKAQTST